MRPEILTAAAAVVGAVVGSLSAGMMALLSQLFENRARRADQVRLLEARLRENLMKAAVDLAKLRTEIALEILRRGKGTKIPDAVLMTEVYYRQLAHLHQHGRLADEAYSQVPPEMRKLFRSVAPWPEEKNGQID